MSDLNRFKGRKIKSISSSMPHYIDVVVGHVHDGKKIDSIKAIEVNGRCAPVIRFIVYRDDESQPVMDLDYAGMNITFFPDEEDGSK